MDFVGKSFSLLNDLTHGSFENETELPRSTNSKVNEKIYKKMWEIGSGCEPVLLNYDH